MTPPKKMTLWNKLATEVDPRFLKAYIAENGDQLTAINPIHGRMALTELFGPCGTGWGYDVVEIQKISNLSAAKIRLWYLPYLIDDSAYARDQKAFIEEYGTAVPPGQDAFKQMVSSGLNRCFMALGHAAALYSGVRVNDTPPSDKLHLEQDKLVQNANAEGCDTLENTAPQTAEPQKSTIVELPIFSSANIPSQSQVNEIIQTALGNTKTEIKSDDTAEGDTPSHPLTDFFSSDADFQFASVTYIGLLSEYSPNLDGSWKFSAKAQKYFKETNAVHLLPPDAELRAYVTVSDQDAGPRLAQKYGFKRGNNRWERVFIIDSPSAGYFTTQERNHAAA